MSIAPPDSDVVSCPDCGAIRNSLRSLGEEDDGSKDYVQCKECNARFAVDRTGESNTVVTPESDNTESTSSEQVDKVE